MKDESQPSTNDVLRGAFTDFLNRDAFNWTSFCTLTFERARNRRSIDSFAHMLRDMCGERERPIRAFIAEEIGHKGGRRHLHALCEHPGWTGFELCKRWERRPGGGWANVREFVPSRGAQHYVTKYILKEASGLGDWDLVSYGGELSDFLWSDNGLTLARHRLYSLTVRLLGSLREEKWGSYPVSLRRWLA